jgi:carbamoyl-phosphate synthase large subunit
LRLIKLVFGRDNNVKIIGVDIDAINITEDREQFRKLMGRIEVPVAPAQIATSFLKGKEIAQEFGFPLCIRPSFYLGRFRCVICIYKDQNLIRP